MRFPVNIVKFLKTFLKNTSSVDGIAMLKMFAQSTGEHVEENLY